MIPLKRNKDLAAPNPMNKLAFTPITIWNTQFSYYIFQNQQALTLKNMWINEQSTTCQFPKLELFPEKSGSSISVCESTWKASSGYSTWTASSGYSLPSASCCLLKEALKETAGGSIECDSFLLLPCKRQQEAPTMRQHKWAVSDTGFHIKVPWLLIY